MFLDDEIKVLIGASIHGIVHVPMLISLQSLTYVL